MKINGRPVWVEIDLTAIYHNLFEIKKIAKGKKIISVVKDDAYGHSAKKVVNKIEPLSDFFGVASIEEAVQLKKITKKPFLIFGGVFDNSELKEIDEQIIPVIYDFDILSKVAKLKRRTLINIEIDTGMTRTGFAVCELERLLKFLKENPQIKVHGLMSHFSSADCDEDFTNEQIKEFKKIVKRIISNGINPEIVHIANSAGIFYDNNDLINAVRPGIMLYGGYPSKKFIGKINLTPAMSFKTKIISMKRIPPGVRVSYGGTFETKRESLIATLSVGYGDGYLRALSNKGLVYVKDKGIAKVCGRVCMDMTMIDVTDLKDVKKGDEVILWGRDHVDVHPDNIAELAGTISYELFCIVTKRVKRIFI